jgi:putative PIN family toxin of toxin-antitoxin system
MTRVVIDANVLASAAAGHPDSPSRRLLAALTTRQVEATLCERLLEELARTLERPYFSRRVTPDERRRFDLTLRIVCEMLPDPSAPPQVLRDPKDDYLVTLAVAGRAEAIVTGDRDLLDHDGLMPPAITPREACERFGLL